MKFELLIDGKPYNVEIGIGKLVIVRVDGEIYQAEVKKDSEGMDIQLDGKNCRVELDGGHVSVDGLKHRVEVRNLRRGKPSWYSAAAKPGDQMAREAMGEAASGEEMVYPPMPGSVVSIKVKEGDVVKAGTPILVLEAMKMQNELFSSRDGVVREVRVSEGDLVGAGDVLMVIGD